MDDSYQYPDVAEWRADLDNSLRKDYGWLALAGLHWLKPGAHRMGSDADNEIRLPPAAPADAGRIDLNGDRLAYRSPDADEESLLQPDVSGEPALLDFGPVRVMAIRRDDRWALRVWDNSRSDRSSFPGRAWFDLSPDHRFQAQFEPDEGMQALPTTFDMQTSEPVAGWLTFELGGQTHRLVALDRGGGALFVTFADATTGSETYGGGRYLYLPLAIDGQVSLDFNFAYNPPCAFTHFATCALPPASNRLPVPIHAGERKPSWKPSA